MPDEYRGETGTREPVARWDVPRTLVVGLGGTGCLSCQLALEEVRKRYGGRRPEFCEFLVFDTTTEASEGAGSLEEGDFVYIAGFNANPYIERAQDYEFLSWLEPQNMLPGEINVGAHTIPHIGRLCYFMHREGRIKSAITNKLYKLTDPGLIAGLRNVPERENLRVNPNSTIYVHIITSLFGGTGAGALLDAANDLRRWCEQYTGTRPCIIAHLLLPRSFQLRCSELAEAQHYTNAYTMLSQINHFMGPNTARVQYKWGLPVKWGKTELPFDLCFLIDGITESHTVGRRTACRRVARTVCALATQYTGKKLWDLLINVLPSVHAQTSDPVAPPVFSSYGNRTARRPVKDFRETFLSLAYKQFADLDRDAKPTGEQSAIWTKRITSWKADFKPVDDDAKSEEVVTGLSEVRDATKALHKGEDEFAEYINKKVPKTVKRTVETIRENWFNPELRTQLLQRRLKGWLEHSAHGVETIPAYLTWLCKCLDGTADSAAPAESPDQLEELRLRPVKTAKGRRTETGEIDLDAEGAIQSLFKDYIQAYLRKAWHEELRDHIVAPLKEDIDEIRKWLSDLAAECRRSIKARDKSGTNRTSDEVNIYASPSELEEGVKDTTRQELKKLLCLLVFEGDLSTKAHASYVRAMEAYVTPPDGELAGLVEARAKEYFDDVERSAKLDGGEQGFAELIRGGLNRLWEIAAPCWKVQAHKMLEEANLLASSKPILVENNDLLPKRRIEVALDPSVDGVVLLRTQHGARLTDLHNFEQYWDAFITTVRIRAQRNGQDEDQTTKEMWLDPEWKVKTLRPPDNMPQACFGMVFGLGEIDASTGRGFKWKQKDGVETDLGATLEEAMQTWRHSNLQDRVEARWNALKDEKVAFLCKTARSALDRVNTLIEKFKKDPARRREQVVLENVSAALEQWLKIWETQDQTQQSLHDKESSS